VTEMRTDHDALGALEVPDDALYGANAARAAVNFAVDGPTLGQCPAVVRAYLEVKLAAARANVDAGALAPRDGDAIVAACRQLLDDLPEQAFPVPLVHGGGGTAANMNVNEVVASVANQRLGSVRGSDGSIDPHVHVNRSQSTNDTYPTVLRLVCIPEVEHLAGALEHLAGVYDIKAEEYDDGSQRLGRTCLRDALPVPIAATHRSQAVALRRVAGDLRTAGGDLHAVPLGATAVGTGAGAPNGYAERVVAYLGEATGLALRVSADPFDALASIDDLVAVADVLERAVLVLDRYARDLRLLSSGPVGGIGEVELPAVQVGSSMMPGKANPVMPELVLQVGLQVRAACSVVRGAAALGELELNVMEPVVIAELPRALRRLAQATELFADRCVRGLVWNLDRVQAHLEGSLLAATTVAGRR